MRSEKAHLPVGSSLEFRLVRPRTYVFRPFSQRLHEEEEEEHVRRCVGSFWDAG
jgi:hypothetical protein